MKRPKIAAGQVYRHKNAGRQRVVHEVYEDRVETIRYHDGICFGYCSKASFFAMCPREVIVTQEDIKIAKELAKEYGGTIVLETVNGKYV